MVAGERPGTEPRHACPPVSAGLRRPTGIRNYRGPRRTPPNRHQGWSKWWSRTAVLTSTGAEDESQISRPASLVWLGGARPGVSDADPCRVTEREPQGVSATASGLQILPLV